MGLYTKEIFCCKLLKVLSWFRKINSSCSACCSLKYFLKNYFFLKLSGTELKDIVLLVNVWLDTKLPMYLLALLPVLDLDRSQEHSADVSISSNLAFSLGGPSPTLSDGSFLLTFSNHLCGVPSLLSKGFNKSAFSAFLFEKIETSPIAAASREMTRFTASIPWEWMRIKSERQKLPTV